MLKSLTLLGVMSNKLKEDDVMTFLRIYTVVVMLICILAIIRDIVSMVGNIKKFPFNKTKTEQKYLIWEILFIIALIPIILLALLCN